jgi:hypothetical protein
MLRSIGCISERDSRRQTLTLTAVPVASSSLLADPAEVPVARALFLYVACLNRHVLIVPDVQTRSLNGSR